MRENNIIFKSKDNLKQILFGIRVPKIVKYKTYQVLILETLKQYPKTKNTLNEIIKDFKDDKTIYLKCKTDAYFSKFKLVTESD